MTIVVIFTTVAIVCLLITIVALVRRAGRDDDGLDRLPIMPAKDLPMLFPHVAGHISEKEAYALVVNIAMTRLAFVTTRHDPEQGWIIEVRS